MVSPSLFPLFNHGYDRGEHRVHPASPERHVEGCLPLYYRPFELEPAVYETYHEGTVVLFRVAVLWSSHPRRNSSCLRTVQEIRSCRSRDGPLHRWLNDENRPAEMAYLVHRHSVEKEEVVGTFSSVDVQPGHQFRPGIHSGRFWIAFIRSGELKTTLPYMKSAFFEALVPGLAAGFLSCVFVSGDSGFRYAVPLFRHGQRSLQALHAGQLHLHFRQVRNKKAAQTPFRSFRTIEYVRVLSSIDETCGTGIPLPGVPVSGPACKGMKICLYPATVAGTLPQCNFHHPEADIGVIPSSSLLPHPTSLSGSFG